MGAATSAADAGVPVECRAPHDADVTISRKTYTRDGVSVPGPFQVRVRGSLRPPKADTLVFGLSQSEGVAEHSITLLRRGVQLFPETELHSGDDLEVLINAASPAFVSDVFIPSTLNARPWMHEPGIQPVVESLMADFLTEKPGAWKRGAWTMITLYATSPYKVSVARLNTAIPESPDVTVTMPGIPRQMAQDFMLQVAASTPMWLDLYQSQAGDSELSFSDPATAEKQNDRVWFTSVTPALLRSLPLGPRVRLKMDFSVEFLDAATVCRTLDSFSEYVRAASEHGGGSETNLLAALSSMQSQLATAYSKDAVAATAARVSRVLWWAFGTLTNWDVQPERRLAEELIDAATEDYRVRMPLRKEWITAAVMTSPTDGMPMPPFDSETAGYLHSDFVGESDSDEAGEADAADADDAESLRRSAVIRRRVTGGTARSRVRFTRNTLRRALRHRQHW